MYEQLKLSHQDSNALQALQHKIDYDQLIHALNVLSDQLTLSIHTLESDVRTQVQTWRADTNEERSEWLLLLQLRGNKCAVAMGDFRNRVERVKTYILYGFAGRNN